MRSSISALRPLVRPAPLPRAAYARALQARNFNASAIRLNDQQKKDGAEEKKDDKKEQQEKKRRAADEDTGPPQSPFKVFLQVFKEEIEKNQGWQQNVKQLSGEVDKMADSKAMKAAREMYERTRVSHCGAARPRGREAAERLSRPTVQPTSGLCFAATKKSQTKRK